MFYNKWCIFHLKGQQLVLCLQQVLPLVIFCDVATEIQANILIRDGRVVIKPIPLSIDPNMAVSNDQVFLRQIALLYAKNK